MFGFKSKLLQLLGAGPIRLFSILSLLDFQGMRFLCGNFSIGFGHVVVFIEVLSAESDIVVEPCKELEGLRTISPKSRTFSPRTKYMPLTISA